MSPISSSTAVECNVVVDSILLSSRCVFKVFLKFLSLINLSKNFHFIS